MVRPRRIVGNSIQVRLICAQKNHAFAWFLKVRPTGIELVSSAPQADTLSIELWALKSDLRISDYLIILTFFSAGFNEIYKISLFRRKLLLYYTIFGGSLRYKLL